MCQTCVMMGRGTYAAADKNAIIHVADACPAKHEPYTRKTSVSDHVGHKPDSSCYGGKQDSALLFFVCFFVRYSETRGNIHVL